MIRFDRWSGRYQIKPKKEVTRNAGCNRSERKLNVGSTDAEAFEAVPYNSESHLRLSPEEGGWWIRRKHWYTPFRPSFLSSFLPSLLTYLNTFSETCAQKSHISIQHQDSILTSVERMRRKSLPNFYLWWYKHRSKTGFRKCWWSLTISILFDDK